MIITAEIDPLRDEGEAYAKKLADAGVGVQQARYNKVTHEFFGLAGAVPTAKEAVGAAGTWLKGQFETASSSQAIDMPIL